MSAARNSARYSSLALRAAVLNSALPAASTGIITDSVMALAIGTRCFKIGIDSSSATPDAAAAFLKSHNAGTLPTFIDDTGEVMKGLKAYGLPMTVLINPKGNIVARAAGPAEWDNPESVAYFKRVAQGS